MAGSFRKYKKHLISSILYNRPVSIFSKSFFIPDFVLEHCCFITYRLHFTVRQTSFLSPSMKLFFWFGFCFEVFTLTSLDSVIQHYVSHINTAFRKFYFIRLNFCYTVLTLKTLCTIFVLNSNLFPVYFCISTEVLHLKFINETYSLVVYVYVCLFNSFSLVAYTIYNLPSPTAHGYLSLSSHLLLVTGKVFPPGSAKCKKARKLG